MIKRESDSISNLCMFKISRLIEIKMEMTSFEIVGTYIFSYN